MLHINPTSIYPSRFNTKVTSSKFAQQKLNKLKNYTEKLAETIMPEPSTNKLNKPCCNKLAEQKLSKIK